ncbi:hypothetical protein ACJJIX_20035 [Microbulbifer sp. VAAC004]|uniref:hypothetical protein n=1 Tax=unclassified Microbulbifer TaxID=2619833 RepID=UPI0040393113
MRKVVLPFALAVASVFATSAAFAATPYKYDYCTSLGLGGDTSKVKGDRYVIAGSTKTYEHEGGSAFYKETALFNTKEGYVGADDYSYQDFKWVAKKNINFPTRGSNYVSIGIPVPAEVGGKTNLCKNINVQSAPTISVKALNANAGIYAAVNSSYDTSYSKAALEGAKVTYTWYFSNMTYPGTNYQKVTTTPYTTVYTDFGGTYMVMATINDGAHSKSVNLGQVRVAGGATPCDPFCTNPAD